MSLSRLVNRWPPGGESSYRVTRKIMSTNHCRWAHWWGTHPIAWTRRRWNRSRDGAGEWGWNQVREDGNGSSQVSQRDGQRHGGVGRAGGRKARRVRVKCVRHVGSVGCIGTWPGSHPIDSSAVARIICSYTYMLHTHVHMHIRVYLGLRKGSEVVKH